jgi:hypothetical protein
LNFVIKIFLCIIETRLGLKASPTGVPKRTAHIYLCPNEQPTQKTYPVGPIQTDNRFTRDPFVFHIWFTFGLTQKQRASTQTHRPPHLTRLSVKSYRPLSFLHLPLMMRRSSSAEILIFGCRPSYSKRPALARSSPSSPDSPLAAPLPPPANPAPR